MSEEGLEAISRFAEEGIKTNCTLIFTANQGLLAAKAGASLLSPFVGRLDDINEEGMDVIRELVPIIDTYDMDSEVLVASVRHPRHVTEAALIGAAHRDAALQGSAADGPSPADGQGHRHLPTGLGEGPPGRCCQGCRGRLSLCRIEPQELGTPREAMARPRTTPTPQRVARAAPPTHPARTTALCSPAPPRLRARRVLPHSARPRHLRLRTRRVLPHSARPRHPAYAPGASYATRSSLRRTGRVRGYLTRRGSTSPSVAQVRAARITLTR